jgi:hypothetical protein
MLVRVVLSRLGNLLVIVRSRVKIRSATLPGLSSDEFLPRRCKSPASRVEGCGAGSCISVESIGVELQPELEFHSEGEWELQPELEFHSEGEWELQPELEFHSEWEWSYNRSWSFTRRGSGVTTGVGVSLGGGVELQPELEFHSEGEWELQPRVGVSLGVGVGVTTGVGVSLGVGVELQVGVGVSLEWELE